MRNESSNLYFPIIRKKQLNINNLNENMKQSIDEIKIIETF